MAVEVTLVPTLDNLQNEQTTTLEIKVDLSSFQRLLSQYNFLIKMVLEVTRETLERYEYAK